MHQSNGKLVIYYQYGGSRTTGKVNSGIYDFMCASVLMSTL